MYLMQYTLRLVVDVTVTSARTNSYVRVVGAPRPPHGSLVMRDQQAKLDVTSALRPPLARLPLSMIMTITPLLLRMGVGKLL
jgi:hypothetical protein